MRVLLIDPNDGFRREAVSLMQGIPFLDDVAGAESVEQAVVALAGSSPPDVVLLALTGSSEPGLRGIRAVGDSPCHPRVVALTVFSEPEYVDGLSKAGAHDWVPKSDFAEALLPCLRRLRPSPAPERSDPHPPMASEVFREPTGVAGRRPARRPYPHST